MDDKTLYPAGNGNNGNLTSSGSPSQYDSGEMAWLMACTAITWIMIPGVGFFYSGVARSKSSLSLLMICLWTCAVVSIQWYLIGFSLCLSTKGNPIIGGLDHLFLANTDQPYPGNPKIPTLLVSIWYGLFAAITPTIILGSVAERTRFLPTIVFIFFWTTFCFDFLTYWTWNQNGWTYVLGALDFGGGTPVHLSTGAAALAFAYMVGNRKDPTEKPPHNMTNVVLGTSFIWFGWLVANAGSGISPNLRAVTVFVTTNISASMGGITWGILDYIRHGRKWSALGFCTGSICGLVAITPASGYVSPTSSLVFGVVGAIICHFCMDFKGFLLRVEVDDSFDVFCVHGIGGVVGNILTGIFAQKSIAGVDGSVIEGGWLDGNWKQVGIQLIDTVAGMAWSFFVTALLLFIINKIPGLHIRADPKDESEGLDQAEMGVNVNEYIEEIKSAIVMTANSTTTRITVGGSDNIGLRKLELHNNGEISKDKMQEVNDETSENAIETTGNL
ncbi:ammonium transporter 1 isoform X2 [Folsomia candida]|uniref:Ammonium transporter n=2 Tax=Folsomia candida TaxID=158441 RepID=A0A226E5D3_FOLCA|nr:ammonium transporter 1 isoform X2 [Folsomia candida]XP_021956162.1 ammonium transporter 1 isoform X2 [Folsomia candida]XP_035709909.1 ammonium transporter 1 isoform X2 [Folsomia candida]OXA51726.1 Ammonium transporter 1 [Folsomia candida]